MYFSRYITIILCLSYCVIFCGCRDNPSGPVDDPEEGIIGGWRLVRFDTKNRDVDVSDLDLGSDFEFHFSSDRSMRGNFAGDTAFGTWKIVNNQLITNSVGEEIIWGLPSIKKNEIILSLSVERLSEMMEWWPFIIFLNLGPNDRVDFVFKRIY